MKKPFLIPMILLSVALVACGKKNNDQAVSGGGVVETPPAIQPYPTPTLPTWPNGDLASFCSYYQGQMSGGVCSINRLVYQNNSQYSFQTGTLNTGISVTQGQSVYVNTSGSPKVYVGGYQVQSGSGSFVAPVSGYLSFYKGSFNTYTIQQISLKYCYSAPNQQTSCL